VHFAFLGTSGAVPSLRRDNTSLVFVGGAESVLVDCGGSPIQKLLLAAVDPQSVTRVVITHLHVDHSYGLPSLIRGLALMGRTAALTINCREEHAEPLRELLRVFRILDRPELFPLRLEPVPALPRVAIGRTGPFTLSASPNAHGPMPNLALRFDAAAAPSVVYSSDTEPCEAVVELAGSADTLIHEATFSEGDRARHGVHSTARQAGEIAARARVRRLILAHIDAAHHEATAALADEARQSFDGEVEIAEEFIPYPL
jgi:ribonuclease Z